MHKMETYTAEGLDVILQSAPDTELQRIHVRKDRKPGRGGMSNGVFEVTLDDLEDRWALKVIDAENFERMQGTDGAEGSSTALSEKLFHMELIEREKGMQRDLSDLRNQYFVRAVRSYEIDGMHLILMPYYDSAANYEGNPEEGAIRLGTDICQALLALHFDDQDMGDDRHGVLLHGDIKPQNIFYEKPGGRVRFKLGDFGSVRHLGEPCLSHSKGYHAPEDMFGNKKVQPNADLFSLGLVMYWYISGKDDDLEYRAWEQRCVGEVPKRPTECSDQLWEIILDATEPDPADRIQTADEMLERLRNVDRKKLATREEENRQLRRTNEVQSTILGMEVAVAVGGFIAGKIFDMVSARQNEERLDIPEVGGWYKGTVAEELPCGKGTYHYSDGSSRTGNWEWRAEQTAKFSDEDESSVTLSGMVCDGVFYGVWIMGSSDGWVYRGEVKNNLPYGTGRFLFPYRGDDALLSGTWGYVEKKKITFGGQRSIYTGMLCNSHPNGRGTLHIPKVGTFTGIFCDGELCVGRFEWISGEIYDGEWLTEGDQAYPDGQGLHILPDNSQYEGQIVKGSYEGYGVKEYPDGSCYEGQWQQGMRHGEGTLTSCGGIVTHAIWENDQPIKNL